MTSTPPGGAVRSGGVNAGFGDGSVRFIKDTVDQRVWVGLNSIDRRRGDLGRQLLTGPEPLGLGDDGAELVEDLLAAAAVFGGLARG